MTSPQRDDANDGIQIGDFLRPLLSYRRLIVEGTLVALLVAALLAGLYYVFQPVRWSAIVDFRPLFERAELREYPNRLPFSTSDIISEAIVQDVVTRNDIQTHCSAEEFRSGLVVQESSPELIFLDLDFQARLSDTRISSVDRQRLQDEYNARRRSVGLQYRLMFARPEECADVPEAIVFKALGEILETWAITSENKRGVMKVRVAILTPAIFDQSVGGAEESLLVRAELVRAAVVRVLANIADVQKLPGSELVGVGNPRVSLAEARGRMEDLMQARLDPLISLAGRGLGAASIQWTEQALQTAQSELKTAEEFVERYRSALREYSGLTAAPAAPGASLPRDRGESTSDVQTLTPQIDRTFIDRIVELSATNTEFRQEITRQIITAATTAVTRMSTVEHYRALLSAMKQGSGPPLAQADVLRRLEAIIREAQDVTRLFNEIYNEFSRISFRVGPAMYRIERPAEVWSIKAFGLRQFALWMVGVALAVPLALSIAALLHYHLERKPHTHQRA